MDTNDVDVNGEDPLLSAIAERAGIDPGRLAFSPIMHDPATFTFKRYLYLDGKKVNVQWTPDSTVMAPGGTRAASASEIIEELGRQLKALL